MLRKFVCLFCTICFLLFNALAQNTKIGIKLKKIVVSDFSPKSPAIDSNSEAVVLADVGSSDFEGNSLGYFTLIYKRHERILLKSRNAFEAATVKVVLYTRQTDFAEKVEDLEASTFNNENGQIIETKLDKNSIYKEKYNRDFTVLKFTLPNLKEGSIIEYKYTLNSSFQNNNIRSWSFQGKYPVLWSEYQVTIPPIFNYAILKQGYLPYAIDSEANLFKRYSIVIPGDASQNSEYINVDGNALWECWAMKDVDAFKEESYISSSENYKSKVKFQLHSIRYSEDNTKQVMKDWYKSTDDLLQDEDFGKPLSDNNFWMEDDLKKVIRGTEGLDKAKKIFEYVRDNFTCTNYDDGYLSGSLKKIYQNKKGNVTDINILLTTMLLSQGFDVHPVLLSTRDNGKAEESAAILNQYNYVIVRLTVDSVFYLLDASVSRLGFGRLVENCYNGSGRLINNPPLLISISADSLKEEKFTSMYIMNEENGTSNGSYKSNYGYFESLKLRNKLAKIKQEDFLKELMKSYPSEVNISNMVIDSVKSYDEPISIKYDIKMKWDDDIIYFNPMFNEGLKKNPFTAAQRLYSVEMPYKINETYILNMVIPKGYKIDEFPKSARVKLNDNEGMFEYIIEKSENLIQLRCKLMFYKANFQAADYQTLRDFLAYVVKKESEQIVFKRIK